MLVDFDKDFLLLTKAKDLVKYTFVMTENTRRYPKKYRFTLVNRMQNMALEIYELINEANELNVTDQVALAERLRLQNKAITKCKSILFLITLSLENTQIALNDRQAEVWARYVLDVKNMAVRWHQKDRSRRN